MIERGVRPYPMVYGRATAPDLGGCNLRIAHRTLGDFQRWVIRRYAAIVPFDQYKPGGGATDDRQPGFFLREVAP